MSLMDTLPPQDLHPPDEVRGARRSPCVEYRLTDSAAVKAAIAASLDGLREWMPWRSHRQATRSVMSFLGRRGSRNSDGSAAANYADHSCARTGEYVGGCSLMRGIGPGAHGSRLLGAQRTSSSWHRHRIPRACLPNTALALPGIRSVEIHCAEANIASARSHETLGFRSIGVVPDSANLPLQTGNDD